MYICVYMCKEYIQLCICEHMCSYCPYVFMFIYLQYVCHICLHIPIYVYEHQIYIWNPTFQPAGVGLAVGLAGVGLLACWSACLSGCWPCCCPGCCWLLHPTYILFLFSLMSARELAWLKSLPPGLPPPRALPRPPLPRPPRRPPPSAGPA